MVRPEVLSASQLQLYLTCSLKYRFQYVDRLPRLTITANQAFGTAIHAAIEWLHKARKAGREPLLGEVLRVFEGDWYAQVATGAPVHFEDDDAAALLLIKGKELLGQFYALPSRPVRDAELYFTLPLLHPTTGEALEVPLRGVMDAVYEDGTIDEYKAPQKTPPLVDLPENLQLTVYSYAYETLFGKPPTEIRKVSLVRSKSPKIDVQTTGRDARDYARLFHIAREMLSGIGAGVFIPNRGCWMCKDCEFQADCLEWSGNDDRREVVLSTSNASPAITGR